MSAKPKPQIIESYLPIFGGFYKGEYDDLRGSYKGIARKIFRVVKSEIESLGLAKVKFQSLWSPTSNNYSTDQIKVVYTLKPENVENIRKYVTEHEPAFAAYLKENFTSYDGFISFYPNDVWGFMLHTDNLTDFTKPRNHYYEEPGQWVGIVLDFILENEGWTDKRICNTINL